MSYNTEVDSSGNFYVASSSEDFDSENNNDYRVVKTGLAVSIVFLIVVTFGVLFQIYSSVINEAKSEITKNAAINSYASTIKYKTLGAPEYFDGSMFESGGTINLYHNEEMTKIAAVHEDNKSKATDYISALTADSTDDLIFVYSGPDSKTKPTP